MKFSNCLFACLSWMLAATQFARAGGSGLNVAVVVNQASSDSIQLGNYYCEKRAVPPDNVVRIEWTGSATDWSLEDFTNVLLNPFLSTLKDRGLTNQIDYVLLSMGIPYRITESGSSGTSGVNSTTAALFYGFKADSDPPAGAPDSCSLPDAASNSYASSEAEFRLASPDTATHQPFLAMMLTHSNLALAKAVVDQGVASDGAFPTNEILLAKSTDVYRNIRYRSFDDAIFNARVVGQPTMVREDSGSPITNTGLLGYENGLYRFSIVRGAFVPGAMADSLTSYGGIILAPNDHTTLLRFLWAGATASYGTVVEPCAYVEKFPRPETYFYQGRGFSIAECYYMSLDAPYQGLLVGEPLAAPFASPPVGSWPGLADGALLRGQTNLVLHITASSPLRPVQQVDLFFDGTFHETITNFLPQPNEKLRVILNGTPVTYTVGAGATLASVASGMTARLNGYSVTNATKVAAFARGDRIELRSFLLGRLGSRMSISASNISDAASSAVTFLHPSKRSFFDSEAYGRRLMAISNAPASDSTLQLNVTRTNGSLVSVTITNESGTNYAQFVQQLIDAINTDPQLTGPDGVVAEDYVHRFLNPIWQPYSELYLRARSPGMDAAQIQVQLTASSPIVTVPAETGKLTDNLPDLQPRNHLYVAAGMTNLDLAFPLDTTDLSDGYHELTAVAYEGTHVRTQERIPINVVISNTPTFASFDTLLGGTNTAVEATLRFQITANASGVERIELFSTGGVVANASNTSSATLSVPASELGAGLHPFYAVVNLNSGAHYRTETRWYRIIGQEPDFSVSIASPPPAFTWPASAGRAYAVRSSASVIGTFNLRGIIVPTNSQGSWTETNNAPIQFYRVEAQP